MATMKTFRFPVDVRWIEGKLTIAAVPGKEPLPVATPPEFNGGVEGVWSPEDLFVGAVATCFAVTFVSMTTRRNIPLRALDVRGAGEVGQRTDGRFGFSSVVLAVDLTTDAGYEAEAKLALDEAEASCLVAVSLALPVHVVARVHGEAAAA